MRIIGGSAGGRRIRAPRGAVEAVLVERAAPALRSIRENLGALGFAERARVVAMDAADAVARLAGEGASFAWVFADPPYARGGEEILAALAAHPGLLDDEGVVVIEHDKRNPPPESAPPLARGDLRRYGDSAVSFYRRSA